MTASIYPKPSKQQIEQLLETITTVEKIFQSRPYIIESDFLPVLKVCHLPIFMNMVFFRKLAIIGNMDMKVSLSAFIQGWTRLKNTCFDDESLFFNIIKKPDCPYLLPEDFLPILEDIVVNHPGLHFLSEDPMFQERYIETVICRIYYEARCTTGKMTLSQFKTSRFATMIKNLTPRKDLNTAKDCFSYKHFYVLYCKFWALDEDHNLMIDEHDLERYNDGVLHKTIIPHIIQHGRIPAFKSLFTTYQVQNNAMTYLDYIWFFISETDKSTTVAIEYWFRCMDGDGDGVITTFDLLEHWSEQDLKMQGLLENYNEDRILFDDIIRQMNDLIQPMVPGQFRLADLKKDGVIAERFFDTFLNIDKFQIHDTYLNLIRNNHELNKEKKKQFEFDQKRFLDLKLRLLQHPELEEQRHDIIACFEPLCLGTWCDYAEHEYESLILNEQQHHQQPEEEDEEEEEEEEEHKEQWNILIQQLKKHTQNHEGEEDSTSSSSEEEEEGDCTTPSTPVLDEKCLKDNARNDWMWRSTVS